MEFKFLFLIIIFMKFFNVKGTCNADEKSKSVHTSIEEKILCNYDKDSRPGRGKNKTDINIHFEPEMIEYSDDDSYMELTTWLTLFWKDKRINWDPQSYKNIKYLPVKTNSLWSPDLMLSNWRDKSSFLENFDQIFATYNGRIFAGGKIKMRGHCVPNYFKWPFDEHNCSFVIISKQYFGHELDFVLPLYRSAISLSSLVPHPQWELTEFSARRNTTYYPNTTTDFYNVAVTLSFNVRRHATVFVASFVFPAIAMIALSITVFWLNPVSSQRILVISVLVILQALFIQYLAFKIHSNGNTIPRIVRFYSASLILSSLLFVLTILTRCMIRWSNKPSWLQYFCNLILTNRSIQLILLFDSDPKTAAAVIESGEDEGLTLVSKGDGGQQWKMFANILNKLVFMLIIPCYIFLFLHFII